MNFLDLKIWDNISLWQKRLVVIVSIIGSISFLYPKYKVLNAEIKQIIEFQQHSKQIEKDIDNLNDYMMVLNGILRSSLVKIDNYNYGTVLNINGEKKLVEVKLRTTENNDKFVFVNDGNVGAYSVSYNNDEGKYSYVDFYGNYHLIYKVDIESTIDK